MHYNRLYDFTTCGNLTMALPGTVCSSLGGRPNVLGGVLSHLKFNTQDRSASDFSSCQPVHAWTGQMQAVIAFIK